ncbi:MAG: permease [Desulfuromonadales bacterium]
MLWKSEWKPFLTIVTVFFVIYFLPIDGMIHSLPVDWLPDMPRLENAFWEALSLAKWYAREHVLLCLVPAFFIAGAVGVFVSQAAVMKYLGPKANKILAYGVASVSGSILAVCSCTILPLFAGIYRMGAGLGPASAFLYSGPAINILAIVLTAAVLGPEMGVARAVGAVSFSVLIGLLMHLFFRREEMEKVTWGKPAEPTGLWPMIYASKWLITGFFALVLAVILVLCFKVQTWRMTAAATPALVLAFWLPEHPEMAFVAGIIGLTLLLTTGPRDDGELEEWFDTSWDFAKKILPLLLWGVLIAGALLGRPEHEGLIPSHWIANLVGGNSMWANLFASVVGAFMYFATLTEVPILQGLIGAGMGKGPALALLLAGPALSLPNMLVIRSVMGTKKTVVFVLLVIIMATISGLIYGAVFG